MSGAFYLRNVRIIHLYDVNVPAAKRAVNIERREEIVYSISVCVFEAELKDNRKSKNISFCVDLK